MCLPKIAFQRPNPEKASTAALGLWLLCNLNKLPQEIKVAVHHNAGGHVNHSLFWRTMRPDASAEPKGLFRDAINRDFGSVEAFKSQFEEEGAKLFGSGWVWLVRIQKDDGKLEVITTYGHDNPMMKGRFQLSCNSTEELWAAEGGVLPVT
ncbi:superoxide dismutase 3 [Methyloglobulus morosus KoM1]|uniref:superoxide dismutase n=1 Tax=Methyloglobulus morosus KoM1 TaxID=1116472 RepID=V5BNJ2_9GAMM|nr:Fe-Mn family superoxide dismutase [Methyloglobulus morosus]ESS67732.1 superoxide dismutase 3 [Methyloglobulus morosus KoM1]